MPGIDESLQRAMRISGARGVSLVDYTSGLVVGEAGDWPNGGAEAAAAGATEVVRAARDNIAFVGPERAHGDAQASAGDRIEDIVLTAEDRYHLLRFLDQRFDGRLFLHLWLDRTHANLAMARLELRKLAEDLVLT